MGARLPRADQAATLPVFFVSTLLLRDRILLRDLLVTRLALVQQSRTGELDGLARSVVLHEAGGGLRLAQRRHEGLVHIERLLHDDAHVLRREGARFAIAPPLAVALERG